jgi:alpha-beta hydrolase superfamily lysophospholipase
MMNGLETGIKDYSFEESKGDALKVSSLRLSFYFSLLLVSGCGVFIRQPLYVEKNEPQAEVDGNYFVYADNKRNYFNQNISPNSDNIIICIPGLGGHAGSYNNLRTYFVNNNIFSVEIDLRGFGHWQGKKGDLRNIGSHINDLNQVVDYYRMNFPDKRIILMGESLGTSLSLWYGYLYPEKIDKLILTSLVTKHNGSDNVGSKSVRNIITGFIFCPSRPVLLGADQRKYSNDPAFRQWASESDTFKTDRISPRYLLQSERVINKSHKYLCKIEKPILLLQGGKDILSDTIEVSRILKSCNSGNILYEILPNCYHNIINDLHREEVFNAIFNFINTKDSSRKAEKNWINIIMNSDHTAFGNKQND